MNLEKDCRVEHPIYGFGCVIAIEDWKHCRVKFDNCTYAFTVLREKLKEENV